MKSIIKPSTREWLRLSREKEGFSFVDMLHGYVYARWMYFYIAMASRRHPLARRFQPLINWIGGFLVKQAGEGADSIKFEDTYHGKVVPLEAAKQLVSVKQDIALGDLEQVIPYTRARDIILKNPDHIAALDCPCRMSRPNPCLPLDVCLVVGEPFTSLVLEHQPKHSRRISSEEAQQILKEEDERGHVHHAFFKDATLGRFYAICNCCSCCCAAVQTVRQGSPMLASSGFVAVVSQELCLGCGNCETTCIFSAVKVVDGVAQVDRAACMGCGLCVNQCAQGALLLERAEDRGIPLEIEKLIAQASVQSSV
jgi:ferredoxin